MGGWIGPYDAGMGIAVGFGEDKVSNQVKGGNWCRFYKLKD